LVAHEGRRRRVMLRTFRERFMPAGLLGAWLLTSVYTVNALIGLQALQVPTYFASPIEITAQVQAQK
jgi:hypothetical protein